MFTNILKFNFLAGTVLLTLISGCASFPAKEIPSISYSQLDQETQKLVIDYEVTSDQKAFNLDNVCRQEVESVFQQSNLFSEIHPGNGFARYHFSVSCLNDYDNFSGRALVAAGSGFISGATLLILPGYANDAFKLSVDVKKQNKVIKHYEYHDSMNTWIELFLVFWMPSHTPNSAKKEIIDNMLLNFLHDLQRDKIITS